MDIEEVDAATLLKAETDVVNRNMEEWAEDGLDEPREVVIVVTTKGNQYQVQFNGIEMDAIPLKLEKAAKVLRRTLMENA